VRVPALRPAAAVVAAALVVVAVTAVPARKLVLVPVSSGQRFLLPWVGLLSPDDLVGGWAQGRVEPVLPHLGWHGMVSNAARSGLKSAQNTPQGMCGWTALPPQTWTKA